MKLGTRSLAVLGLLLSLQLWSAESGVSLVSIDASRVSAQFATMLNECNADVDALLSGSEPMYAQRGVVLSGEDGRTSFLGDGGTRLYQGHGYRITMYHRLSQVAGIEGFLVGPEVEFETALTGRDLPAEFSRVSFVRFVAKPSTSPNKSPEPTATAVTPPAAQEPRRP